MQRIQCQNIKCEGCVKKINDALLEKYPDLRVDIATQSVEIDAKESELQEIKIKLQELGFLSSGGFFNKFNSFFNR